jgi:hypothetical protein
MFAGKAETYPSGAFNCLSLNMYDPKFSKILDEEQSVDSYMGLMYIFATGMTVKKFYSLGPIAFSKKNYFVIDKKAFLTSVKSRNIGVICYCLYLSRRERRERGRGRDARVHKGLAQEEGCRLQTQPHVCLCM